MPRGRHPNPATDLTQTVRIDKWLWAARFYKTRSLAITAIEAGHVRLNEQRCKPGRNVHSGDRVQLVRPGEEREVIVRALSTQRGPTTVAQSLYDETPESLARREKAAALRRAGSALAPGGERPTKRNRRELERLRKSDG